MAAAVEGVELAHGTRALLDERLELHLEAKPRRGQGWLSFVREYCGTTSVVEVVQQANARQRLLVGLRYRIPFAYLLPEHQLEVAAALFAEDRPVAAGWWHRVGRHRSKMPESLWRVSQWFTGRGDNYRALREANDLADDHLEPGQVVLVPARLLRPAFRQALPEESAYHLRYDEDAGGEFAIYRLKPGEALYSSVAVRFAGLVYAEDVNQLTAEIAERSGIGDVTDIPVGYEVKIPLEILLPEFLPAGHPDRREYEASLLASARYSNQVEARRLDGVTVIVDAGHGGRDPGSSIQGVWESVYVYDIALRLKRVLEATTGADVFMTTQAGHGYSVPDRDRLDYSRDHRVLTTPDYPIVDASTGVNLRWYLTNSLFRRAVSNGGDVDKVVFLSVHADSLHPTLRGAMAYIPGARYRKGSYGKTGAVYASRREVREQPRVSFSRQTLEKSEGLSRQLAQDMIDAFEAASLAVHPDKPVRNRIVRSRRQAWVPAVLRYSEVPAQLLLEVCNLNNEEDRALIQTQRFRQQVAEVTVQGILHYYDTSDDRDPREAP
ncbi:MAG: N-acetylmuramoyl-L-alanine amidase [Acidobacteria bacterium]|nr:N-acetylmuramoyl-L-alanine amidase [Acidobacteriota bacterium]